MPLPEPTRSCLTEEERKRARAVVVKKSLRYFEDRNNRSFSEDCLFTRRRNLAAHLGVDETVSKKELNMINVHALPLPSSVQKAKATSKGYYLYLKLILIHYHKTLKSFLNAKYSNKMNFSLNKRESIESSVQCPSEDGFDDIGLIEDVENNQGDELSVSCTSNSSQPNYQTITGDDDDISISSSVDTCRQSNCKYYTCCEIESCDEEVFAVTQCPKEASGGSKDINEGPEIEYKGKDLTSYLGMLDCVSSSIAEHKVCQFHFNQNTKFRNCFTVVRYL